MPIDKDEQYGKQLSVNSPKKKGYSYFTVAPVVNFANEVVQKAKEVKVTPKGLGMLFALVVDGMGYDFDEVIQGMSLDEEDTLPQ
jgi:hypothetical protein